MWAEVEFQFVHMDLAAILDFHSVWPAEISMIYENALDIIFISISLQQQ